MQIKPSTAAGPPINITGVDASAEKNIQSGAKCLRFIADEYYKDKVVGPGSGRSDPGLTPPR